jgi:hypothetical protein
MKIFSGYGQGEDGKMKMGLGVMLPPLVGGTGTLGTALLLRAFVKPVKTDAATGAVVTDDKGQPKISPWFKYAGLFGAGVGTISSIILGPFMGWGATLSGVLTSLMAGGTAQLTNMVVPKEFQQYRGLGLVAMNPRHYGRYPQHMRSPMVTSGMGNLGAIAATPVQRKYLKPGRGPNSMPAEVLQQMNPGAFGPQTGTGMGF